MKPISFKKIFIYSVLISFFFTFLDYLGHFFIDSLEIYYYPVPDFLSSLNLSFLNYYAIGKFVSSILMIAIIFFVLRKYDLKPLEKSSILTIIVVLLIEVRYIISGQYGWLWHYYNFILHFITLIIPSYLIIKLKKV